MAVHLVQVPCLGWWVGVSTWVPFVPSPLPTYIILHTGPLSFACISSWDRFSSTCLPNSFLACLVFDRLWVGRDEGFWALGLL